MRYWILVAMCLVTMGADGCITPQQMIDQACEVVPPLPCVRVDEMIDAGELEDWPCSCVGPGLTAFEDPPLPLPVAP